MATTCCNGRVGFGLSVFWARFCCCFFYFKGQSDNVKQSSNLLSDILWGPRKSTKTKTYNNIRWSHWHTLTKRKIDGTRGELGEMEGRQRKTHFKLIRRACDEATQKRNMKSRCKVCKEMATTRATAAQRQAAPNEIVGTIARAIN